MPSWDRAGSVRGWFLMVTGDYLDIPRFRGLYQEGNLTIAAWVKLNDLGFSSDLQDSGIFTSNGNNQNSLLLWYNVNASGTGNRTYTFNLGSTGTGLNRLDGPDGVASQGKWQHVVAVMEDRKRFLYADGQLVAEIPLSGLSSLHMEGSGARIGSWDAGPNLDLDGILDEVRIYGTNLSQADVSILYGEGFGDLGIIPIISVESENSASTMQGRVEFFKFGASQSVSGFTIADLSVSGGSVSNFSQAGNVFLFGVSAHGHPSALSIQVPHGAALAGSTPTSETAYAFRQHPPVTENDNLVLWYVFEDKNQSVVADFSGNDNHGTLSGSGSLVSGKFSHSLALQPSESLSADGGRLSLSSEVSLSVWTKIRDDDYGIIAQSGQVRLEYHDDNTIRASVRIGNTWSELRARSVLGKWVHYCAHL